MADTAVVGHRFRFGVSAIGGVAATRRLALDRCNVRKIRQLIEPEQKMRGQIARDMESVSEGPYVVSGGFDMVPRPDELYDLLLLICGGSWVSTTLDPGLLTDNFVFQFDRLTKLYTYGGCKFTRTTFASSAGQQLRMACELEGATETEGLTGDFPTLSLSTQPPMTHHMAVATFGGSTYNVDNVQISIENPVDTGRFFNSGTRTEVPVLDRICRVSCEFPFTANEVTNLYKIALSGIAANFLYTNGGLSLQFLFPCLQASPENVEAAGKTSESRLRMEFVARQKSGDPIPQEYQIILDKTP
jgi:hypothetical protein